MSSAITTITLGGAPVSIDNVLYVSPTGDNATAIAGRIDKPYLTVQAAVTASAEGDAIVLLPGDHLMTGPAILKNNARLTSLYGSAVTKILMDGSFPIQNTSNQSGQTAHGAYLQPSPGVSGEDKCEISDLNIQMLVPSEFNGRYTAVTGVNTATGTGITGTGASFADMYVRNCTIKGFSDIHYVTDAAQRTYFDNCTLTSNFDLIHHISPTNNIFTEFNNCRLRFIPFFDTVNFFGPPVDTNIRIRSGKARLKNCSLEIVNDGLTDWSIVGGILGDYKGIQVDDFAGAVLEIIGGLPWSFTGNAYTKPIVPMFTTSSVLGTGTKGAVIVDGYVPGLADYPDNIFGNLSGPVKIIPRSSLVITSEIFAGSQSATKNNTYRAKATASSQTMYMTTLPPGAIVRGVRLVRQTAFSGGAGSATTIEVGIVGNTTKYMEATNVRTTGTALFPINFVEGSGDPFATVGTQLVIVLRNTGANVSTLTAGSVLVSVELDSVAKY